MKSVFLSEAEEFKILLEEIDSVLERYTIGDLSPNRVAREIIRERAEQRPILEKAIQLATEGLKRYPFNTELLRRRAYARCHIVTPDGEYPEIQKAEEDLWTILDLDPNNLYAAFDLLENLFTSSGMEDKDVAEVARELATKTETLLLGYQALQIKAFGYAGEHAKAEEVYNRWIRVFPDSESLKSAKDDADSMKGV
jgi:tetratricopeptide (TPR) repeat protein